MSMVYLGGRKLHVQADLKTSWALLRPQHTTRSVVVLISKAVSAKSRSHCAALKHGSDK